MTPASDATCPLTGADRPGGDGGPVGEACLLTGVMVLTSTLHRRCTPKTNLNIPTILTGRFDGGIVDVLVTGLLLMLRVGNPVADEDPVA